MDDQLQELINLQKEQNQLLKKYLWRFRFSLLFLMLLTTATAVGLGLLVYQDQRPTATAMPTTTTPTTPLWSSSGTLQLQTIKPQVDFEQVSSDMLQLSEQPKIDASE
jgi:hypothetical protein